VVYQGVVTVDARRPLQERDAMRVLITSQRLTGHLRPLFPYAHALIRRGHEVRVATPLSAAPILAEEGLDHAPFDHPGAEAISTQWATYQGDDPEERIARGVATVFAGLLPRTALPALEETVRTWRPDLILRESTEFTAPIVARKAGLPHARVNVGNAWLDAWGRDVVTGAMDALYAEAGLAPDAGASLRDEQAFSAFPAALDGDAPASGGPPLLRLRNPADRLDPAAPVPDWARDDGRPLVFISLGTLAAENAGNVAVYRAALEAVADLPVRVLLSTGGQEVADAFGAVPGNVTVVRWVAQAEIFPRADALICHGGAGTILAGLAAGRPMVIVPLNADQPDNARRVVAAGAGLQVAPRDVEGLRAALDQVLTDPDLRAGARRIAAEMAALPGMEAAVDALERIAAG
jgi:UDP:flavonoid glycosyltransferase YjiC (YdhE family)